MIIEKKNKLFKKKNKNKMMIKGAGFTVAKNTFVKQQQSINEEELQQEESETIDLAQVTTSETHTEIN
ncbi:hypothetical protein, partial [Poseidonibacter lekithochrous]|uniref:hypothetical protein n=1 Tax=Poseidonibacter lekithochrous TaxID=1904463 RepID=UPI00196B29D3